MSLATTPQQVNSDVFVTPPLLSVRQESSTIDLSGGDDNSLANQIQAMEARWEKRFSSINSVDRVQPHASPQQQLCDRINAIEARISANSQQNPPYLQQTLFTTPPYQQTAPPYQQTASPSRYYFLGGG